MSPKLVWLERFKSMGEAALNDRLLRVVIADHDSVCRQRTKFLLTAERNVDIVAECTDAQEIIDTLRVHRPDLLLLDPQIPGGNPLDLLAQLPPESLPRLIFTTAQDQYAIKAFETRAFDYIMKPFNPQRFHTAIERARVDLKRSQANSLTLRQVSLIRHVQSIPEERLIVKSAGRVVFLDFNEVDWIEAAANYVAIHAGNQVYRLREPIGQIEQRVARHNFARIHRCVIVSVSKIKEVYPCNSGEYMVRLTTGKELACSRGYNSAIRTLLSSKASFGS
jgi:two-component system, LytTR family, response regulator